jgi:hypothetical protein
LFAVVVVVGGGGGGVGGVVVFGAREVRARRLLRQCATEKSRSNTRYGGRITTVLY